MLEDYNSVSRNIDAIPERISCKKEDNLILLPKVDSSKIKNTTLIDALNIRRTSRSFQNTSIAIEDISLILHTAFYINPKKTHTLNNIEWHCEQRTSPSSTGLAAIDGYVVCRNVDGIPPNVYLYDSQRHALIQVSEKNSHSSLSTLLLDQYWADDLPAGIFLVSDLRRTWIKDISTRGYIANFLDAGHLSQTLLLLCTALNYHTWLSGAFRDDLVENYLGLEHFQLPTLFIGFGKGEQTPLPKNIDSSNN